MRAAIIALGAIFLLLSLSHSAAAHGDVLRAKVIFLGLGSGVISPDGSSVVGLDLDLDGVAVWRRGKVRPLERDPENRVFGRAVAASHRARVVVGSAFGSPEVSVWSRGHRRVLTSDGEAWDVSKNGRVIVGLVRDPVAGDVGTRWHKGVPRPITAQPGFQALSGLAVSASGRTIFGIGTFDGGSPTRFLWNRGRAIEVEGLSDAVLGVEELSFGAGAMLLSSDGSTVAAADVTSDVTTCHDTDLHPIRPTSGVCLRRTTLEGWRWRNGELERLGDMGSQNIPADITANGEVIVGSGASFGGFLWDRTHGVRSLVDLLESLGADFQGHRLMGVSAISDDGRRILGTYQDPSTHRISALSYLAILPPACSDRIDNDGDGRVDYPEDRGCRRRNDNDESGERRHRRKRN